MPTIIGLGYKARQGKNYVANYMQEYNPQVQIYAFADELKLYCKEHHNELEPQWQLAHQTKAHPAWKADAIYGCTPILQWYGTDVARKENPNVWVQALDKRLSREAPEIAVVTDVRFENEAKYIKEKGGYLVQVIRRNADGTQFVDSGRDPNHISETALDAYGGFDFIIEAKFLTALLMLMGTTMFPLTPTAQASSPDVLGPVQDQVTWMMSSWYGDESGSIMANGKPYNKMAMTVAHRTLPFGTHLLLINPTNNRGVIVTVTDRGPFIKGRSLDCSEGVALKLGFRRKGIEQLLAIKLDDIPVKSSTKIKLKLVQIKSGQSRSSSRVPYYLSRLSFRTRDPLYHVKHNPFLMGRALSQQTIKFT